MSHNLKKSIMPQIKEATEIARQLTGKNHRKSSALSLDVALLQSFYKKNPSNYKGVEKSFLDFGQPNFLITNENDISKIGFTPEDDTKQSILFQFSNNTVVYKNIKEESKQQ